MSFNYDKTILNDYILLPMVLTIIKNNSQQQTQDFIVSVIQIVFI